MDKEQKIMQNAFVKNQKFLIDQKRKALIAKKHQKAVESENSETIPTDPDLIAFKDFRQQQSKKKVKTNLDLLEKFNQTALQFVPIYQKRIEQKESIDKIESSVTKLEEQLQL